jgi:hypothetical protein
MSRPDAGEVFLPREHYSGAARMSPHTLHQIRQAFPFLLVLALAALPVFLLVHRARSRWLGFTRAPGPREPAFWGLLDVLLAVVFWFAVNLAAGMTLLSVRGGDTTPSGYFLLGLQAVLVPATVGIVIYIGRVVGGQPWRTLGFASAPWTNLVPLLILCGVLHLWMLTLSSLWAAVLHDLLGIDPQPMELVSYFRSEAVAGDRWNVVAFVISGAVLAPIGEEVFFRGFLFGCLRQRWGVLAGALASSLFFALAHTSLLGLVPLTAMGCFLCYLYQRTGSLAFPMLYHGAFNGMTFLQVILASAVEGGA